MENDNFLNLIVDPVVEEEMKKHPHNFQYICPICYSKEDKVKKAKFDLKPYCYPACDLDHMREAFQKNIELPYRYYNKDKVIAPYYVWNA